MVARPLWERKAAGSNPATPTRWFPPSVQSMVLLRAEPLWLQMYGVLCTEASVGIGR